MAAVEYINANTGRDPLTVRQRENIQGAIKLGVIVNNYWDEKILAYGEYRQRRRTIGRNGLATDYRRYYRDITSVEKNRPDPRVSNSDEVFEYREKLNAVALGGVCAMAELGRYYDFINEDQQLKTGTENWFSNLWKIVMALQVIDDQIGWVGDVKHNRPSFYTGLALGSGLPRKEINSILDLKRREYLKEVENEGTEVKMEPLMMVVGMLGIVLPKAYEVLRKVPGGHIFMKGREKHEG